MSNDDRSDSLTSAMMKVGIPSANHRFISRFTAAIGITAFYAVDASTPYVRAVRRDGAPDLRIYWGYTTGFVSEAEILRVAGGGIGHSKKGVPYVTHPTNQVRPPGGERSKDVRRNATRCECGMELSLTGVCASCD